jgi:hypothetical protein
MKYLKYYYRFIFVIYLASIFFPAIRPGVGASVFMLILYISNMNRIYLVKNTSIAIVLFYLFYSTITIVLYSNNNLPFMVYFSEYSNSILPAGFFFIAYSSNDKTKKSFMNEVMLFGVLSIIIGFYFLVFDSEVYSRYLHKTIANFTEYTYSHDKRLNSLFGSVDMGTLSVILLILSIQQYKNASSMAPFIIIISILGVILSQQRSAYVATLGVILYSADSRKGVKSLLKLLTAIIIVYVVFDITNYSEDSIVAQVIEKFYRLKYALSDRSDSWINAFSFNSNIYIGKGLGSVGHKALGLSELYIRDGNYLKIFFELGIIGTLSFLAIIGLIIRRIIVTSQKNYVDTSIVLLFLFQAIGSNVLSFQVLIPIFWFTLGTLLKHNTNTRFIS